MNAVVDASVAIKWVIPEHGTEAALALLHAGGLIAPDLIVSELANILWKKTQRGELTAEEANTAAHILEQATFEIVPTRTLLVPATDLAIRLRHPAYDCVYLALALDRKAKLITADARLLRRLAKEKSGPLSTLAAALPDGGGPTNGG